MVLYTFRYHEQPEGKAIKDKISSLVRLGGMIGFARGSLHLIQDVNRKKWPILECLNIYGGFMLPPMAMGFTYAVSRYALTNIRKKDDNWNGFLAGVANTPIVYAWFSHRLYNEPRLLVLLPILCGLTALALEYGYQNTFIRKEEHYKARVRPVWDNPPTYSTWGLT